MDLLSMARKIWRYRLFTLPVVILTLCGAAYVLAVKQPVYEATSSFALLNPPAPPTAEDIARDPALGRINADNPYTRLGDQSVIIQVLASTTNSDAARRALKKAGVDSRYTVTPSADLGYASPIEQVTAVGSSAETAILSAKLVGDVVTRELDRLQAAQGVDKRYRIKTLQVAAPDEAQLKASGTLRVLVGVLVMGALALFIVVSVMDAFVTLRRESLQRLSPTPVVGPLTGDPQAEPWQVGDDSGPAVEAVVANGRHPTSVVRAGASVAAQKSDPR